MEGKIEELMNMCFYTNEIDELTNKTNDTKASIPSGWKLLEIKNDQKSGFVAAVYKKNGTVSIVIKGSDFAHFKSGVKDYFGTNMPFVLGKQPIQYEPARDFYNSIKQKYGKNNKIMIIGSSLGGGLAQYLGAKGDCKDKIITFSAVGAFKTAKKENPFLNKIDGSNIYNFVVDNDPIANLVGQYGNVKFISSPGNSNESALHKKIRGLWNWKDAHCVGTVKKYTPKEILNASVDEMDKVFSVNKTKKLDLLESQPVKLNNFNPILKNNPVKSLKSSQLGNSCPFKVY